MDITLRKRRIVWAGDSIVAPNGFATYPQTGMGQGFRLYTAEDAELINLAVNGRSTKSFIDEQRMPEAYFTLGEGDFFFIQFGHNDQKKEDPLRYAAAYGDYQLNLEKFYNVASNRGAEAVFITPPVRRHFGKDGRIIPSHGDYPAAMKEKAAELGVLLVDLQSLSKAYIEAAGAEESRRLFMNFPAGRYANYPEGKEDNSHLTADGARIFAGLVAADLWAKGEPYRAILRPECAALSERLKHFQAKAKEEGVSA